MLFLAIFGKNVEDSFGHVRYLALYIAGGFVAALTQTLMTLIGGSAADAAVPVLGASGAIAAVLGAYFVSYPDSRILTPSASSWPACSPVQVGWRGPRTYRRPCPPARNNRATGSRGRLSPEPNVRPPQLWPEPVCTHPPRPMFDRVTEVRQR
jgi:hypothetical protein